MLKEERFQHMLEQLKTSDKIYIERLSVEMNVSGDTIRRDIDLLSRTGLLVKVRGGAISPSINPLSFHDRAGVFTDGKQVIGLKAQQLLMNAKTVFMDGGTTMIAVAAHIPLDAQLRIITNNVALIPILAAHESIEIIVLGGGYNRITKTNVGVQTCQQVQQYKADLYLMGVCALDARIGITSPVQEDGEVKRAMLHSAHTVAGLCNQEKLETIDYFAVTALSGIDVLVTDLASDDNKLNGYRQTDLQLL